MRLLVTVLKVGALLVNMAPINHCLNRADTAKRNISLHSSFCTLDNVTYVPKPVSDEPLVHSGHVTVFCIVMRRYIPRSKFLSSYSHFSFRIRGRIVSEVTCCVDEDLM